MSKPAVISTSTEPSRRQALAICLVTIFMTLLDVSIVNLTLPQIQQTLHLSSTDTTWIVSGNALIFGLVLIPAGRLGDMYGRRRLMLAGLWLFALTAIACAVAPNATVMVVARLLRGAASGLLAPQAMGLIQRMFDGPRRGKIFGYFGAIVGLSTALGPLLSGVLIEIFGANTGWRLAFWVTVPVVALALGIGYRALPADPPRGANHKLDVLGTVLIGITVVCVMLPVLQASGRNGHPRWWLLGVGAVFGVLFVLWERRVDARGDEPVIAPSLARVRSFSVGLLVAGVFFAGFTSIFLVMSMFLQQGLKFSALHAALVMLIFTAGSSVSAVISGRLAYRFGRWIVVIGGALAAIGVASIALVAHQATASNAVQQLAIPLLVGGFGCGLLVAANQTLSLQHVRHVHGGVAAAMYETSQRLATALGMAVATSLYFRGMGTMSTGGADSSHTNAGGAAQHPNPGGDAAVHANGGAGAPHGNGGGTALHDTAAGALTSVHKAVAFGLAAPAVLLGLAAVVALVDVLWPRRTEPQPQASPRDDDLRIAGSHHR